jgi:hypothetical protein
MDGLTMCLIAWSAMRRGSTSARNVSGRSYDLRSHASPPRRADVNLVKGARYAERGASLSRLVRR